MGGQVSRTGGEGNKGLEGGREVLKAGWGERGRMAGAGVVGQV